MPPPKVLDEKADPAHFIEIADRERDTKNWPVASENYRRALELKPDLTGIRVQFGNMLKELGRYDASEAAYRQALGEKPSADTYLQLGHLLKLQCRYLDAQDAYLKALNLDPALQDPRDELRALGVSNRLIDRHLAAVQATELPTSASPSRENFEAVRYVRAAAACGVIVEITPSSIVAEAHDISVRDLPLVVAALAGDERAASFVIDDASTGGRDEARHGSASLSRRIRIDVPDAYRSSLLHIRFEPDGKEFVGSPLLLPNESGASLLRRVEELELFMAASGLTTQMEARLEQKLLPAITSAVFSGVEAVLTEQRDELERRLAIPATGPSSPWQIPTEHAVPEGLGAYPARVSLRAQEPFPGLGWSEPSRHGSGLAQCWMGVLSHLTVRIDPAPAYLFKMTVSEALSEHFVRGLRIRANGAFFPYWIESVGGSSRCWKLAAILPGSARHADATVTLEISTIDALSTTSGQFRRSVAVSAIELIIVPSSPQSAFCFDAESPWLLSGWEPATPAGARLRDDASTVLLPTLASAPNATVSAFGDDLDLIASVALNGAKLQRRENATPLVFEILREQWAQHVNLLTFYLSLDPVAAAAERRPAIRSVEIAES